MSDARKLSDEAIAKLAKITDKLVRDEIAAFLARPSSQSMDEIFSNKVVADNYWKILHDHYKKPRLVGEEARYVQHDEKTISEKDDIYGVGRFELIVLHRLFAKPDDPNNVTLRKLARRIYFQLLLKNEFCKDAKNQDEADYFADAPILKEILLDEKEYFLKTYVESLAKQNVAKPVDDLKYLLECLRSSSEFKEGERVSSGDKPSLLATLVAIKLGVKEPTSDQIQSYAVHYKKIVDDLFVENQLRRFATADEFKASFPADKTDARLKQLEERLRGIQTAKAAKTAYLKIVLGVTPAPRNVPRAIAPSSASKPKPVASVQSTLEIKSVPKPKLAAPVESVLESKTDSSSSSAPKAAAAPDKATNINEDPVVKELTRLFGINGNVFRPGVKAYFKQASKKSDINAVLKELRTVKTLPDFAQSFQKIFPDEKEYDPAYYFDLLEQAKTKAAADEKLKRERDAKEFTQEKYREKLEEKNTVLLDTEQEKFYKHFFIDQRDEAKFSLSLGEDVIKPVPDFIKQKSMIPWLERVIVNSTKETDHKVQNYFSNDQFLDRLLFGKGSENYSSNANDYAIEGAKFAVAYFMTGSQLSKELVQRSPILSSAYYKHEKFETREKRERRERREELLKKTDIFPNSKGVLYKYLYHPLRDKEFSTSAEKAHLEKLRADVDEVFKNKWSEYQSYLQARIEEQKAVEIPSQESKKVYEDKLRQIHKQPEHRLLFESLQCVFSRNPLPDWISREDLARLMIIHTDHVLVMLTDPKNPATSATLKDRLFDGGMDLVANDIIRKMLPREWFATEHGKRIVDFTKEYATCKEWNRLNTACDYVIEQQAMYPLQHNVSKVQIAADIDSLLRSENPPAWITQDLVKLLIADPNYVRSLIAENYPVIQNRLFGADLGEMKKVAAQVTSMMPPEWQTTESGELVMGMLTPAFISYEEFYREKIKPQIEFLQNKTRTTKESELAEIDKDFQNGSHYPELKLLSSDKLPPWITQAELASLLIISPSLIESLLTEENSAVRDRLFGPDLGKISGVTDIIDKMSDAWKATPINLHVMQIVNNHIAMREAIIASLPPPQPVDVSQPLSTIVPAPVQTVVSTPVPTKGLYTRLKENIVTAIEQRRQAEAKRQQEEAERKADEAKQQQEEEQKRQAVEADARKRAEEAEKMRQERQRQIEEQERKAAEEKRLADEAEQNVLAQHAQTTATKIADNLRQQAALSRFAFYTHQNLPKNVRTVMQLDSKQLNESKTVKVSDGVYRQRFNRNDLALMKAVQDALRSGSPDLTGTYTPKQGDPLQPGDAAIYLVSDKKDQSAVSQGAGFQNAGAFIESREQDRVDIYVDRLPASLRVDCILFDAAKACEIKNTTSNDWKEFIKSNRADPLNPTYQEIKAFLQQKVDAKDLVIKTGALWSAVKSAAWQALPPVDTNNLHVLAQRFGINESTPEIWKEFKVTEGEMPTAQKIYDFLEEKFETISTHEARAKLAHGLLDAIPVVPSLKYLKFADEQIKAYMEAAHIDATTMAVTPMFIRPNKNPQMARCYRLLALARGLSCVDESGLDPLPSEKEAVAYVRDLIKDIKDEKLEQTISPSAEVSGEVAEWKEKAKKLGDREDQNELINYYERISKGIQLNPKEQERFDSLSAATVTRLGLKKND